MLQDNPWTGLWFAVAVLIGTVHMGVAQAALGMLIGVVVSTAVGNAMGSDPSVQNGLYGYNGALVGIALPMILPLIWKVWVMLVVGSAWTVPIYLALEKVLQPLRLRVLTAPFVLVT